VQLFKKKLHQKVLEPGGRAYESVASDAAKFECEDLIAQNYAKYFGFTAAIRCKLLREVRSE